MNIYLKPLNMKAKAIEKRAKGEEPDFHLLQQLPFLCSTVFDPGWEVDGGYGFSGLCQPVESDLYGCYSECWWPSHLPDALMNYPDWSKSCPAPVRDWQRIKLPGE